MSHPSKKVRNARVHFWVDLVAGPSWYWADSYWAELVLGRVGSGPSWYWAELFPLMVLTRVCLIERKRGYWLRLDVNLPLRHSIRYTLDILTQLKALKSAFVELNSIVPVVLFSDILWWRWLNLFRWIEIYWMPILTATNCRLIHCQSTTSMLEVSLA